jgi:glycerol uptake facilitator-like aquaporin
VFLLLFAGPLSSGVINPVITLAAVSNDTVTRLFAGTVTFTMIGGSVEVLE